MASTTLTITEAWWGDIDSDEFTTLDSAAKIACRRWILEDLTALHRDAPPEVRLSGSKEEILT